MLPHADGQMVNNALQPIALRQGLRSDGRGAVELRRSADQNETAETQTEEIGDGPLFASKIDAGPRREDDQVCIRDM